MNNFIKWQTIEYIEYKGLKIPTRLLDQKTLEMILNTQKEAKK